MALTTGAERVAVAGMGPVGMVAALSLARAGVPVVVLERGADLATESRASTFHPPTLEMLERLGVVEGLLATGIRAPVFQQRDRRDGVLANLDLSVLAGETRFPFRLQNEQVQLTRLIRAELEACDNVELRFACELLRVENGSDHVVLHTSWGEPEKFSWLVAADGSRSAARASLGVAFEGITYPERFLVISSEHDWQGTFPDLANVSYVADPSEWMVLLRTPRHWRALFPVQPEESDAAAQDPEAVQRRLQGVSRSAEPYPVAHTTLYYVHQRVAATFNAGRVLLAGDAAHINNPLGGMGMNSGIHDAYLLARSLAPVWHQAADESVLDEWAHDRRRISVEHVQKTSDRNFSAIREQDSMARKQSQDRLRRIAADPELARKHLLESSMLDSVRAALD